MLDEMTATEELNARRAFMEREGYRECDIDSCNCGSWHGGHAARRLRELHDLASDSGIGLQGETLFSALEKHFAMTPPNLKETS
jgi:hypothetical protein